jgi:hypothetical protein
MVAQVAMEKELVEGLLAYADLTQYFKFQGVDADDDLSWKS